MNVYFTHRPLHVAARNGLTMVVQELLGKGASVLAVDENGKFSLFFPLTFILLEGLYLSIYIEVNWDIVSGQRGELELMLNSAVTRK